MQVVYFKFRMAERHVPGLFGYSRFHNIWQVRSQSSVLREPFKSGFYKQHTAYMLLSSKCDVSILSMNKRNAFTFIVVLT